MMDLIHYEDWLRPEHRPRCCTCGSPVVHHRDEEGTQSYEELYTEDVAALVAEVKRQGEQLSVAIIALKRVEDARKTLEPIRSGFAITEDLIAAFMVVRRALETMKEI